MLTFGITTSTKRASLSLHENEKLLYEITEEVTKTHSTTILAQINELLEKSNKKLENITDVVVSVGPGSFTGVRIAISVVKGLFYSKNVKVFEVNELDALAYQVIKDESSEVGENSIIYSLIDSGKEKIYYGKYRKLKENKLELIGNQKVGKLDNLIEEIKKDKIFKNYIVGDAGLNYIEKIVENLGNKVKFIEEKNMKINSSTFYEMYKLNVLKKVDLFILKPNYLEKSQAERDKENGI